MKISITVLLYNDSDTFERARQSSTTAHEHPMGLVQNALIFKIFFRTFFNVFHSRELFFPGCSTSYFLNKARGGVIPD